jgi:hypothetical protein
VVAVHVGDVGIVTIHIIIVIISWCLRLFRIFVLIQTHLYCSRRNVGVELVVQPMDLLM